MIVLLGIQPFRLKIDSPGLKKYFFAAKKDKKSWRVTLSLVVNLAYTELRYACDKSSNSSGQISIFLDFSQGNNSFLSL